MAEPVGDGPLVSIILPTYNGARHLREALRSCLDQSWPHLELIVVVDGSTDESRAILDQESDSRLRVLDRGHNRGLPESLNEGFAAAKGDYLTWTSDDNRYHPSAIGRMVDVLQGNDGVDLVYAGYALIDDTGRTTGRVDARDPTTVWIENPVGACFLYRRRLAEVVGPYRPEKRLIEDYDYWLRASQHGRFAAIDDLLYDYREHPLSLTGRLNVFERARASARLKYELGGVGRHELRLELARVDAADAFSRHQEGYRQGRLRLLACAAIRDPRLLTNRGVWSVARRAMGDVLRLGGGHHDSRPGSMV